MKHIKHVIQVIRSKKKLQEEKHSLRNRLIIMMVVVWLVPVSIIFAFISFSYRGSVIKKTESILIDSVSNFSNAIAFQIDEAVQISKKVSYEKELEDAWKAYKEDRINQARLYSTVIGALNSKFHNDKRFTMSCFYFTEAEENLYYTRRDIDCYLVYKENVHQEALKISHQDTSDAHIKIIDGRIYIIRNLYTTTGYQKFATLTVELNTSVLLEDVGVTNRDDMKFFINEPKKTAIVGSEPLEEDMKDIFNRIVANFETGANDRTTIIKDGKYAAILYEKKERDYQIGSFLILNQKQMYSELERLNRIMIYIWLIIVPIIVLMYLFLRGNITLPMQKMIRVAKEVRKGKLGVQLEEAAMPNQEFEELKQSFNKMSKELKNLFDFAYNEEMARKDAKIIALQSQINPHFLNNTLEMMNWQARMSGDITVSKMIEALGTLLDYSMDRNSRRLIPLSEELRCADAYFYIISMRFGQRLIVEKEVDDELLQIPVPQLILQPILENAIKHGVEVVKKGHVWLNVYREEENVILSVINTGKDMTIEDQKRINDILGGNYHPDMGEPGIHVSLGIRNVNERIQLIYGENYGLTIEPYEEGKTISKITIPYERKVNDKREEMYKNIIGDK